MHTRWLVREVEFVLMTVLSLLAPSALAMDAQSPEAKRKPMWQQVNSDGEVVAYATQYCRCHWTEQRWEYSWRTFVDFSYGGDPRILVTYSREEYVLAYVYSEDWVTEADATNVCNKVAERKYHWMLGAKCTPGVPLMYADSTISFWY